MGLEYRDYVILKVDREFIRIFKEVADEVEKNMKKDQNKAIELVETDFDGNFRKGDEIKLPLESTAEIATRLELFNQVIEAEKKIKILEEENARLRQKVGKNK